MRPIAEAVGANHGVGMDNELRRLGDKVVYDGPFAVDLDRQFTPRSKSDAKTTIALQTVASRVKPEDSPKMSKAM